MPELVYPRTATVLRENGVVSQISERSAPRYLDKKQRLAAASDDVAVDHTVRTGMVRQPNGGFDWPDGHPNESLAKRRAREAASDKPAAA